MAYEKINIVEFKGLDLSTAPEILKEGELKEIVNFRMEKLGKLSSRNGYIVGMVTSDPTADNKDFFIEEPSIINYYVCRGIVGIGELILSSKWDKIDTDRLMVYGVIGTENPTYDPTSTLTDPLSESRVFHLAFLFSPLTGDYKNILLWSDDVAGCPPGVGILNEREGSAQNDGAKVKLYAPNKRIGDYNDDMLSINDTDFYLDAYQQMNQYGNKLVISDRLNGDMVIEDDYDLSEGEQGVTPEHNLRLRPNCLAEFDINIVGLDLRMATEQENDATDTSEGVEHGMGLYKYVLPKKTTIISDDNYKGRIANADIKPEDYETNVAQDGLLAEAKTKIKTRDFDTLFSIYNFSRDYEIEVTSVYPDENNTNLGVLYGTLPPYRTLAHIDINRNYNFVFTNAESITEYDDILGEIELAKEQRTSKDGLLVEDYISDIYIWEEYQVRYYPSTGREYNGENYLLTEFDRLFNRVNTALNVTELIVKDKYGRHVPLGVWRYRYVWDYGNGQYSAPSAEILCPDIMWSQIRFGVSDIKPQKMTEDKLLAECPIGPYYIYWTQFHYLSNYSLPDPISVPLQIYGVGNLLTPLGEKFMDLKHSLWGDVNHKYGVQAFTDRSTLISDINAASTFIKEQLAMMTTAHFSTSDMELKGILWEGRGLGRGYGDEGWVKHPMIEWGALPWASGFNRFEFLQNLPFKLVVNFGKLIVPIFQRQAVPYTFSSVFDDEGRYRHAYRTRKTGLSQFSLVFPGHNCGIGGNVSVFNPTPGNLETSYNSHIISKEDGGANLGSVTRWFNAQQNIGEGNIYWNNGQVYASMIHEILFGGQGGANSNIYLNVICDLEDYFNITSKDVFYGGTTDIKNVRPSIFLRAIKTDQDRLIRTNTDINVEALDRLVLTGIAGLEIVSPEEKVGFNSELISIVWAVPSTETEIDLINRDNPVSMTTIEDNVNYFNWRNERIFNYAVQEIDSSTGTYHYTQKMSTVNNLKVVIYSQYADRFIGIEQLTSYFPSSLLFKTPRMGIKIADADIPTRAKRLLIFRTKSSHSTDFIPSNYGLVKTYDIRRWTASDVPTDTTGLEEGHVFTETTETYAYKGIYFFDDVKDDDLDFSDNPSNYDGLRLPLKSRFNVFIQEEPIFGNVKERWQALPPRDEHEAAANLIANTNYQIFDSEDSEGFNYATDRYIVYKYFYKDALGYLSTAGELALLYTGSPDKKIIVLYYLPTTYDVYIESLEIYRGIWVDQTAYNADTNPKFYWVGNIKDGLAGEQTYSEGIFTDDNKVNGRLLGNTDVIETSYPSGIKFGDPYKPDKIGIGSTIEYGAGDGGQITGLISYYGNLIIFKERAIYRVKIQREKPDDPLSREELVSDKIGCIAPNTLLQIDNILYFLSYGGIYMFNNNDLMKIDSLFDEELKFVISQTKDYAKESTAGYNQFYNEIYFNLPKPYSDYHNDAPMEQFEKSREIYGHIYVLNLNKKSVTKFDYPIQNTTTKADTNDLVSELAHPLQVVRLYHNNSLGELRSGDIYKWTYDLIPYCTQPIGWAGIYIETPYIWESRGLSKLRKNFLDRDWIMDHQKYRCLDGLGELSNYFNEFLEQYPPSKFVPVDGRLKTGYITGGTETILKRLRQIVFNIYSGGPIKITVGSFHHQRINFINDNEAHSYTYNFSPTEDVDDSINNFYDSVYYLTYTGTNNNILRIIPASLEHDISGLVEDFYGKGVGFYILIETEARTQLNAIVVDLRLIHSYLL